MTLYLEGIEASAALADQRIVVEVDPDGAGPLGFIAKDAVRSTVAKIELRDTADNNRQIIGGYIAWIAGTPRMPQLHVRVRPDLGATGLPAVWSLKTEYRENGRNDEVFVPGGATSGGSMNLPIAQEWDIAAAMAALPNDLQAFGGRSTLRLTTGSAFEHELQFRVRGKNPEDSSAKAFIQANTTEWFAYAIAKHESRDGTQVYNQFYPQGSVLRPARDKGLPLFGGNPQGWGLMQLDFSRAAPRVATIAEIWNWQENVRSGLQILGQARGTAMRWMRALTPGVGGTRPFGQRPQSQIDAGGGTYQPTVPQVVGGAPIPVPVETSANCTFSDGTPAEIEDAVTMKVYNGATSHYVFWNGPGPNVWAFNRTNNAGFNYVARVCAEVEP